MHNTNLKILHVHGDVISFSVDSAIFYLKSIPNYQLFDSSLNKLTVANIDFWVQNVTKQRHSFLNLLDMASAYADAIERSYTHNDLLDIANHFTKLSKSFILHNKFYQYSRAYWVECMDISKLESEYISEIRTKFDQFVIKFGRDAFYNHLCRMLAIADNLNRINLSQIITKLISRLGLSPDKPKYPDTTNIDNELFQYISSHALDSTIFNKKIDESVYNNTMMLAKLHIS